MLLQLIETDFIRDLRTSRLMESIMLDRQGKCHINNWVRECAVDWVALAIYNEMDLIKGKLHQSIADITPRCCLAGVSIRLCTRHQELRSFVESSRVPHKSRFEKIRDSQLVWAGTMMQRVFPLPVPAVITVRQGRPRLKLSRDYLSATENMDDHACCKLVGHRQHPSPMC